MPLENVACVRVWDRSREAQQRAREDLAADAKAVSSSYISPDRFDSDAGVVELLAMKPVARRCRETRCRISAAEKSENTPGHP
jgi:hypothetical protein